MKTLIVLLSLIITLYADKKWIPIVGGQIEKEKVSLDMNLSKSKEIKSLGSQVRVIKYLLDKQGQKKDLSSDTQKMWYRIENIE